VTTTLARLASNVTTSSVPLARPAAARTLKSDAAMRAVSDVCARPFGSVSTTLELRNAFSVCPSSAKRTVCAPGGVTWTTNVAICPATSVNSPPGTNSTAVASVSGKRSAGTPSPIGGKSELSVDSLQPIDTHRVPSARVGVNRSDATLRRETAKR
jgi:hypothetical protein